MANKLKIERESGALTITYAWRTPAMWFLAFFSIIWDLFIVFFLATGAGLFISFHLLAGIFITWLTITRFLNKSTITVDRQRLEIAHGPIPWPFAKEHKIPAGALEQLFVSTSNVKVNDQHTYDLKAKLDTGVEVKLVTAEQDKQLLLDLERTIETYLDIKNDTSFDLGNAKFEELDLQQMKEQLEQMKKLKKWLPGSIVKQMEMAEAKMEQQAGGAGSSAPPFAPASAPPVTKGRKRDDSFFRRTDPTGPKPLPAPTHNFTYPLYYAQEGTTFKFLGNTYRLGRSAQLDWVDDNITTGRQLEALAGKGGDKIHFYAQNERDRWSYFEERRLDDDEVAMLGFTGEDHPLRFENGQDRYYPREEQTGTRYVGSSYGQAVRQFIYFTTASGTQFRALKPEGGGWEVYVMEVVDGGNFDAV